MQITKSSITLPTSWVVCVVGVVGVVCVVCLGCFAVRFASLYFEGLEQRKVNEAAREIRQSFYEPVDAMLLTEHQQDDFLAYGRDCTGTVIQLDYGVDRPIDEIIEEYHRALIENGWRLSPTYGRTKTDTYAFYQKGPELEVHIGLALNRFEEPVPYQTKYRVWINYTSPEHAGCTG